MRISISPLGSFAAVASLALTLAACGGSDSHTGPKPPLVPALDSVSPRRGTVGTVVRIDGRSFSTDSVVVYFGSLKSPLVQQQSGALFAAAPAGLALNATYDVRVVNKGGGADTLVAAWQAVAPTASRVNGATKPTGLVGMTVLIEGDALGDAAHGKVYFTPAGGTPIQAVIADSANDWTNDFIVTAVPQGVSSTAAITVQTATGTTSPITITMISGAQFSPSVINWASTTALPQPLQGLGAVFLPSASSSNPASYVFVLGGAADSTNIATTSVYSAAVQSSGAIGAWNTGLTQLPAPRAYLATAAATAFNSPLDTLTTAGYLYALGGVDAAGVSTNTVYMAKVALDGTLGAWQQTTALPVALHSASAVIFRGYVYLAGGANNANVPTANVYRAPVNADGTLGAWQAAASLPYPTAYLSLLNFGPYIYTVGGDSGTVAPALATTTGTDLSDVALARINLRDGTLPASWTTVAAMSKGRSKHTTLAAGGYLFTTSGVYSGAAGSSENTYAAINSDGTVSSWLGATGSNKITVVLGYDLYNQAAVSFTDAAGHSHVLVLGGSKREAPGRASAGVVYY